ncbi:MAG: hypothetical protein K2M14_06200 [Muribaculaceae bacterium]|nr:hypothetical protein [Muribaculaceae bacterium]
MRIISIWPGSSPVSFPATIWLNEACLLRPGRPFFIPDWDSDFRWMPMLALKIDRVGKSIPARFAHRYVSQASVWLQAVGGDTAAKLAAAGLPLASAVGFDYSLASAPFEKMTLEQARALKVTLSLGSSTLSLDARNCPDPAETLATLSFRNTVRTGDLILLPLASEFIPIIQGDEVSVALESPHTTELLRFSIK